MAFGVVVCGGVASRVLVCVAVVCGAAVCGGGGRGVPKPLVFGVIVSLHKNGCIASHRVGGGDGKIVPADLPSEGEGGVVLPFKKVQSVKGDHVTSQWKGDNIVNRVDLAHPLLGLPCSCRPP